MSKSQAELWIEGGNAKAYTGEATSMKQPETGAIKRPVKREKHKGGE